MGHFLAVTAFQLEDEKQVTNALTEYCNRHGASATVIDNVATPDEKRHALVYGSISGWTLVIWPAYFNLHDVPLSQQISEKLKIHVSTISVYDDDYWCHYLFNIGQKVDEFCSRPDYWAQSEEELAGFADQYKGSPEIVARNMNIDVTSINRYYQPLLEDKDYGKAYPNDTVELDDIWVFVDFWGKLGIKYPDDIAGFKSAIDLTTEFSSRLPQL